MSYLEYLKEELAEMAAPRNKDFEKIYYHGTPKAKNAIGIYERGIEIPDLTLRKGKLKPVEGKVYITPDIQYAIIYALGAAMLGHDMYNMVKNGYDERYGYLFSIDGKELKDIQPDEDSIGEILYNCFKDKEYEQKNNLFWLTRIANQKLTVNQIRHVKDGEYADWAASGKKLIKFMTDEQKLRLIDIGAHIGHGGNLSFKEAWRIDKAFYAKYLKPDGSNFFELADKVNSKNDIPQWNKDDILMPPDNYNEKIKKEKT